MKKILSAILFVFVLPVFSQASSITSCHATLGDGLPGPGSLDFTIEDFWNTRNETIIKLPEFGSFQIIYSTKNEIIGKRLGDNSGVWTNMVRVTFNTTESDSSKVGNLRVGQMVPPRNMMGKFIEYHIACQKL